MNATCWDRPACTVSFAETERALADTLSSSADDAQRDTHKTLMQFTEPLGCADSDKYIEVIYTCIDPGGTYSWRRHVQPGRLYS